jgi:hypothetical protein
MTPQPQIPDPVPPPLLPPLPPQPDKLSEFERLTGVFFSPAKAFADIARRSRWWIPVILMGIASTIYLNAYSQRVGWERIVRQSIEQSSRADAMSAQQREQAIAVGANVARYLGYGGGIVGNLITVFITAVVLLFMANNLMGADIRLGGMLGIVSYAFLPQLLVAALSLLVMYLKPPDDFDLRNPLLFNAGALLPSDAPQWEKGLGSSVDLFSFWIIGLIAAGISAAAPKIKFGKALTAVLFPWGLYVALKIAYLAAFS